MKIKTCKLRAADAFRAKNDVRHYLNGIRINKDYVQATNGHVAIQMDSEVKTRLDVIVRFIGRIPKSAYMTKLEFAKGKNVAYHYDSMQTLVGVQMFEIEEGRFPDFTRIIKGKAEWKQGAEFPMLNCEYLALAHKAFGNSKNKFIGIVPVDYSDKVGAVTYTTSETAHTIDYGNPVIVIMPMRQ